MSEDDLIYKLPLQVSFERALALYEVLVYLLFVGVQ